MTPASFSPSLFLVHSYLGLCWNMDLCIQPLYTHRKTSMNICWKVSGVASSLGFSRQQYWSGLPVLPPVDRRWHHRLYGHDFEQGPGDGIGQGSLACCSPWVAKSRTERLNNKTAGKTVSSLLFPGELRKER